MGRIMEIQRKLERLRGSDNFTLTQTVLAISMTIVLLASQRLYAQQASGTAIGFIYQVLKKEGTPNYKAGVPTLSGWTVYSDLNNNGKVDDNEPKAMSAADGKYTLKLSPGKHRLKAVVPSGWEKVTPMTAAHTIDIAINQNISRHFANFKNLGTATGIVYQDNQRTGSYKPSFLKLQGWTVYSDLNKNGLWDQDEPFAVSDEQGKYEIDLSPGQHFLRRVGLAGMEQVTPLNEGSHRVTISAGTRITRHFGNAKVVSYEDFGAIGDGQTDDIEAIAKAHEFANKNRLRVRANDHATYYIGGKNRPVTIKTDTNFGSAKFVIDDTNVQNIQAHIFAVRSSLNSFMLDGIITSLKQDQLKLNTTMPARSVVHVTNSNVKQFIRKGWNANEGSSQTDAFLVDAEGNVDPNTPILWDFDKITHIIAYPMDENVLTIKGGHFTTIANQAESKYTYYARGILIARSNVMVDGLVHHVTGEGDHGAPYLGFIRIHNSANVTVRNTVLTGRKKYVTINEGRNVEMGSYDIALTRALNVTFENCRQTNDIHDPRFWGIMVSDFSKNINIEGSSFSRFDAHQGVYNASVRNSTIGHMGIFAIGKGTLLIENTTVQASNFIRLRPDYGSTWQGELIIRNSVFKPTNRDAAVLVHGANSGNHDFGYTCHMPHRITIHNLHIDDSNAYTKYKGPAILANFNPDFEDSNYKPKFPYVLTREINLKNVSTASGKPLRISDNTDMFKDVIVNYLSNVAHIYNSVKTAE